MRARTRKLRHESLETRMLLSATLSPTGLSSNSAMVGIAAWPTAPVTMTSPLATGPLLAVSATTAPLTVASVTASSNDGNVPQNTLDGNLSTRWSANGDGQHITYDLGSSQTVSSVKIAFHQGTTRVSKFDILTSTDGTNWSQAYTGQSSGTTNSLEQFSFTDTSARYVRIVGHMNTVNTWNSLTEVSILVFMQPAPLPDPTPTDAVALKVAGVTASSNDGNVPQNTLDGNLSTRWSANGDGQYITYDLGASQTVSSVKIAFHQGTTRVSKFDILTSTDGTNWTQVYTGQSSGTTNSLQQFSFTGTSARYVRIVGHMNTVNTWNSITEVSIMGKQTTPVPTPTPDPDPIRHRRPNQVQSICRIGTLLCRPDRAVNRPSYRLPIW